MLPIEKQSPLTFPLRPIKKIVPDKAFQFLTELIRALHLQQAAILEKTVACYSGNNNPQFKASHMLDKFISNCLE